MEIILTNIVNIYLRSQLLFVPLILLYVIMNLKKQTTGSKWMIHRLTSILFLLIPIILLVISSLPNKNYTRFEIPPDLDVKKSWTEKDIDYRAVNIEEDVYIERTYIEPVIIDDFNDVGETHSYSDIKSDKQEDLVKIIDKKIDLNSLIIISPIITIILFLKLFISLISQYFLEKKVIKKSILENFKGINTYYSELITSPFSTGIVNGKIFLPMSYYKTSRTETILYHEKGHIDGRHIVWKLVENINSILNWFNPLSYFYIKSAELLKELIADEEAVRHSDSIKYSKIIIDELINLKNKKNYYLATGFIKKNIIKERINNLMNPKKEATTKATKVTGVLIIFICMLLTITVGCNKTKIITDPTDFSYVKLAKLSNHNEVLNIVKDFSSTDLSLRHLSDSNIQTTKNGNLSLAIGKKESIIFTILDQNGLIINEIEVDRDENVIIRHTLDNEDNLVILFYNTIEKKGKLIRFLATNKSEKIMSIKDIKFDNDEYADIKSIKIDKNDTLYIDDYTTVHVYKYGKRIKWKGREDICSMTVSPEGILYFIPWSDTKAIKSWNSNTDTTNIFKTPYENLLINWQEDKLLIMDTKGFKQYHGSDFKGYIAITEDFPDLLSLWNTSINKIDNRIYVTSQDFNNNEFLISAIDISNLKRVKDTRNILTIQVSAFDYQSIKFAADKYNLSQKNIKVDVIQMEDYGDNWDSYIQKVNSEILSGSSADILSLSQLPYSNYIDKGILEDLNRYIDGENSVTRNDYMSALTGEEGSRGLFGLTTTIGNSDLTFSVKESTMQKYGYSGSFIQLSWDEFLDIANMERKRDPSGMEVYPLLLSDFENYSDYYFLMILSFNNYFIDSKSGTINEQDFKTYLNLIKILNSGDLVKPKTNGVVNIHSAIIEQSVIFSEQELLTFWERLSLKKHLYNSERVSIVHPTITDRGLKYRSTIYGIVSSSKYKKEAWDFLKYLLGDEYQRSLPSYKLPVNRSVLKERTENSISDLDNFTTSIVDDLGEVVYSGVAKYTQKDMNDYYEYIDRYDGLLKHEQELEQLIFKQIRPFIRGERTVDETISSVKDRVNTYINE